MSEVLLHPAPGLEAQGEYNSWSNLKVESLQLQPVSLEGKKIENITFWFSDVIV